jgi:hypothetical protein
MNAQLTTALKKFALDLIESGMAGAIVAVAALPNDSAKEIAAAAAIGFASAVISAARRYLVTKSADPADPSFPPA